MRVTWKPKYLIPYLIDSVTNTTLEEKIVWAFIFTLGLFVATSMTMVFNWQVGLIFFSLILLAGRFPIPLAGDKFGQYPMSDRKYYEVIKKE